MKRSGFPSSIGNIFWLHAGLLAGRINCGDGTYTVQLAFEIGCSKAALPHGHLSVWS